MGFATIYCRICPNRLLPTNSIAIAIAIAIIIITITVHCISIRLEPSGSAPLKFCSNRRWWGMSSTVGGVGGGGGLRVRAHACVYTCVYGGA